MLAIEEASLDELRQIVRWLDSPRKSGKPREYILIGGWAVYLYNDYSGSIDIDILASSRTCSSLSHWLRENRKFGVRKVGEIGWSEVFRPGPDKQDVIVDMGRLTASETFV